MEYSEKLIKQPKIKVFYIIFPLKELNFSLIINKLDRFSKHREVNLFKQSVQSVINLQNMLDKVRKLSDH